MVEPLLYFSDVARVEALLQTAGSRRNLLLLNPNPLDLVQGDLIRGTIIQLRRPRTLVCSHKLRILERTTRF